MPNLHLQSFLHTLRQHPLLGKTTFQKSWTEADEATRTRFHLAARLASGDSKTEEKHLLSAFSELVFTKKRAGKEETIKPANRFFHPAIEAGIDERLFPKANPSGDDDPQLAAHFQQAVNDLPADESQAADALFFLIQRFGAALPSGRGASVSLFDFAKISAAMAFCLQKTADSETPFLLVGGGISGIQPYLYDIVSRRAAKNLKGRSFYVHLLNEQILLELCERLGLHRSHIVYQSGGGFYLLAPNTEAVKIELKKARTAIRHLLFSDHKTGLFLEMDWVEMNQADLLKKQIGPVLKSLNDKLSVQKRHKFSELLTAAEPLECLDGKTGYDYFFKPLEEGGEDLRDVITNEVLTQSDLKSGRVFEIDKPEQPTYSTESGDKLIGELTCRQVRYGGALKNFTHLVFEKREGKKWSFKPAINGQTLANSLSFQINPGPDSPFLEKYAAFDFYGGNRSPLLEKDTTEMEDGKSITRKKGELKNFNDLSDDGSRIRRLATLRMDIDSLGSIFKAGFKEGRSLAQFSAFSRSLDWFFKGWLNHIRENEAGLKDFTQILYAGGDDLFIVGKWDCLLLFAQKIRADFAEWTGHHPAMSLSGGVAFVTHKFPILKAADMAGKAEGHAKDYEIGGETLKNAFTLFGRALHWERDMPTVEQHRDDLKRLPDVIRKSIISKIQRYHEQKTFLEAEAKRRETPAPLQWRWRIAYDFARAAERIQKHEPDAARWLDSLKNQLFTGRENNPTRQSQHTFFDLLVVAARWAELEIRRDD